jgi:hypothetical protein
VGQEKVQKWKLNEYIKALQFSDRWIRGLKERANKIAVIGITMSTSLSSSDFSQD